MIAALSVRQPWADLIVNGVKDVENRPWSTGFRGPVLIHAGKQIDVAGAELYSEAAARAARHGRLGAIVGAAFLYGCSMKQRSKWHESGFWGFYLADQIAFDEPILYPGKLSLFQVDVAKLYRPITMCTRCKTSVAPGELTFCGCCAWYLEGHSHVFAPEQAKERQLYQDYLQRKLITEFEGK